MKPKQVREKEIKFVLPVMSWERPAEVQLLEFVRHMASSMEEVSIHNHETGWFANNSLSDNAGYMAKAYRTVENKIREIIDIKSKL